MKRRTKNIIINVVLIVLFLSVNLPTAEAHHYTYLVEDPIMQTSRSNLSDNWVLYKWWNYDVVKWYADGGLYSEALNAIDLWRASTAMPDMLWEYWPAEATADLHFYSGTHPDALDALGYTVPVTYVNRDPNGTPPYPENASYLGIMNIWINPNPPNPWTSESRQAQIAHEIGHLFGLNEKYIQRPDGQADCNNTELSIMDAVIAEANPMVHCDNILGPTQLDIKNARQYWGKDYNGVKRADILFTGVGAGPGAGSSTIGVWRTKDLSWAENGHQVAWYWWNGSTWVMYHDEFFVDWIGAHFLTDDRVLFRSIDRTQYPLAGPGAHMMCGKPWFQGTGQFGNYRCSNLIVLN